MTAPKGGWTLVKKSSDKKPAKTSNSVEHVDEVTIDGEEHGDADVDSSMILGDLESEVAECDPAAPLAASKGSHTRTSIREDADKIVHGIITALFSADLRSMLP
jgi:hypothetical protein